ncbi:MAG TPA: DUF2306 domain-containing protein [Pseudonocardiaceae bacterium]|jgi:hypothetical protein|nr:DUF2306 domain-containing protein [Pseudonocardiaceae bacterium]
MTSVANSSTRSQWLVPTALILLIVVPVAGGADRVAGLAGGAHVTPANARFFAEPVPVLVHIFSASLYCVLGAFQFASGFRRRRPGWHRMAGRLLVLCGLAAGLAGLWMALFYPDAPGDGALLRGFRLVFGSAMVACIALGFAAIRRRDITRHRAWMIRGYAIAQGAGSQAVISVVWLLLVGTPVGVSRALLMAAGWMINLAVAQWIIRRQTRRSAL